MDECFEQKVQEGPFGGELGPQASSLKAEGAGGGHMIGALNEDGNQSFCILVSEMLYDEVWRSEQRYVEILAEMCGDMIRDMWRFEQICVDI